MMLVIILATFAFEFTLRYGIEAGAGWAMDPILPRAAAAIWCVFIGMSAGRNLNLAFRFFP